MRELARGKIIIMGQFQYMKLDVMKADAVVFWNGKTPRADL